MVELETGPLQRRRKPGRKAVGIDDDAQARPVRGRAPEIGGEGCVQKCQVLGMAREPGAKGRRLDAVSADRAVWNRLAA